MSPNGGLPIIGAPDNGGPKGTEELMLLLARTLDKTIREAAAGICTCIGMQIEAQRLEVKDHSKPEAPRRQRDTELRNDLEQLAKFCTYTAEMLKKG